MRRRGRSGVKRQRVEVGVDGVQKGWEGIEGWELGARIEGLHSRGINGWRGGGGRGGTERQRRGRGSKRV